MTEYGMSELDQGRIATLRLEPRFGRGLSLRTPAHGRTGWCHGLARGDPQRFRVLGDYATLARIVTNSSAAVG